MNKTVLYPGLSSETFSLDRETIKKKTGEIFQVSLCVTKIIAECGSTTFLPVFTFLSASL